jgi:hypothetical protein
MMLEGWSCPACGRAHAPDVKTCPEPRKVWPPEITLPEPIKEATIVPRWAGPDGYGFVHTADR